MNGKRCRWNLNVGMPIRKKSDCTLLATIVVHFQEGLYVHIVGSLIGDVDEAETGRSSGCVLRKGKKRPAPVKQIIFLKNPYLKHFE